MSLDPVHEQKLRSHAVELGVDPDFAVAVGTQESGSLGPSARSAKGARGLMQVMPATSKEMAKKYGRDLARQGVAYLGEMEKKFSGLVDGRKFALAAYNAGPTTLAKAQARAKKRGLSPGKFSDVERFLPKETRNYIPLVLGNLVKPMKPITPAKKPVLKPALPPPIIGYPETLYGFPSRVRGPLIRTSSGSLL